MAVCGQNIGLATPAAKAANAVNLATLFSAIFSQISPPPELEIESKYV
jgi:hypothetical protein